MQTAIHSIFEDQVIDDIHFSNRDRTPRQNPPQVGGYYPVNFTYPDAWNHGQDWPVGTWNGHLVLGIGVKEAGRHWIEIVMEGKKGFSGHLIKTAEKSLLPIVGQVYSWEVVAEGQRRFAQVGSEKIYLPMKARPGKVYRFRYMGENPTNDHVTELWAQFENDHATQNQDQKHVLVEVPVPLSEPTVQLSEIQVWEKAIQDEQIVRTPRVKNYRKNAAQRREFREQRILQGKFFPRIQYSGKTLHSLIGPFDTVNTGRRWLAAARESDMKLVEQMLKEGKLPEPILVW